jgi:hypothetical protein
MIAYLRHICRVVVVAHPSYVPQGYTRVRHGGLPAPRRQLLGDTPTIVRSTIEGSRRTTRRSSLWRVVWGDPD